MRLILCAVAVVLLGTATQAQQQAAPPLSADQIEFFEKKIRPIFVERCYKCHSAASEKVKGGLLLDSREGLLKGGDSGPAIVPGDPEKSILIKAIRQTDELRMPIKEKLPDDQVADFVAWVKMGAPDPRLQKAVPVSSHPVPSLTEARRSVQALRPAPLEEASLPEALGEMARRWSETSAVELSFATTGEPRPLLAEVEMALFRVAQEALANVTKHAEASKVGLTLSYTGQAVLLDVRDDGVGFLAKQVGGDNGRPANGQGFGLEGMRQRLRRVAGSLEIESAPGDGTAISASVPAVPAEGGR